MDCRLYQKGIILLVLCVAVVQQHTLQAQPNESQRWRDSLTVLNKLIETQPWSTDVHLRKAAANLQLKQWQYAIDEYGLVLQKGGAEVFLRLSLAIVLQQLGRKQEALDQLNQTIQMHADSAVAYAARANVERQMKLDDAALYDWERAEQLAPRDPTYVVSHVDLLLVLERRTEARKVLDAAVRRGIARGMLLEWYEKCKR